MNAPVRKLFHVVAMAAVLAMHLTDVAAAVDRAAPEMKPSVKLSAEARNDAINLVAGMGRHASRYIMDAGGNPVYSSAGDQIEVLVTGLVEALKGPHESTLDADLVHGRVLRIAQIDPRHPIAQCWRVLHTACFHWKESNIPEWTDIAELVAAGPVVIVPNVGSTNDPGQVIENDPTEPGYVKGKAAPVTDPAPAG